MGKTSVLIVDDDQNICETLKDVLIEKGYKADFAESGTQALGILKETFYEVILLDLKMPVMDGLQTFREIKKSSSKSVVIMMTAFSLEEMIKDCLREGEFGVLHKPLDIDKIVKQIDAAKNGILVMIVDDDPEIARTLGEILKRKNFWVTLAKDGQEAIRKTKETPQHIIIVDMRLPALNGLETYLAIKEINPKVKCIFMSAYKQEMKELAKQVFEKNVYSCLYKPFPPKLMLDLVEEIALRIEE